MNEKGSAICQGGKIIGVHHTHPSGSLRLSEQDKRTARNKGLKHVCVSVERNGERKTKCYRLKKTTK